MLNLKGSYVALTTPFKKGKVDYRTLQRNIEFQARSGTTGVVPCGTTGESPTLSHLEHKKVIEATVEAAGSLQVIAGAGSNSTEEAVSLTRFARQVGAHAVLSVVPYYNKPTQEGLYRHFKEIALKGKCPIVLYNIPARCGTGLTPQTIERLSHIELVVGIKEATGSMDQASEILSRCDLAVLSGDDSTTLPLLSIGASGVISVVANIFPQDVGRMIRAFADGHHGLAAVIHHRLYPLCKALFVETNPIPIKTAINILRMGSAELRLPLTAMSSKHKIYLKNALLNYKKERWIE